MFAVFILNARHATNTRELRKFLCQILSAMNARRKEVGERKTLSSFYDSRSFPVYCMENIDEKRQKSVYSLLNLNINFRSHNRLVHDNNDGKDGKCRTERKNGEKLSSGGQRDDIIRKNYILQDSREFL